MNSVESSRQRRSPKTYLYCAISLDAEATMTERSPLGEAHRHLRLGAAHLAWRYRRRFWFDYRDASDFPASNMGDIAIRDALVRILGEAGHRHIVVVGWGSLGEAEILPGDHLIIGGSGYLLLNSAGALPRRIVDDLDVIEALPAGVSVSALGIGMNRPGTSRRAVDVADLHESTGEILRRFCLAVPVLGVRDEATAAALKAAHPAAEPHITADPALYLAPEGSHPQQSSVDLRISVNMPFHGPVATEVCRSRLADICRVLVEVQRRHNAIVSYAAHFDSERVVPALMRQAGVRVESVFGGSPASLLAGYARQHLHIGHMLHSCIMAASVDTPSIGLAYDNKTFGFFDLMNEADRCTHFSEWTDDWLLERIREDFSYPAEGRHRLAARKAVLWRTWENVLRDIHPATFSGHETVRSAHFIARRAIGGSGHDEAGAPDQRRQDHPPPVRRRRGTLNS